MKRFIAFLLVCLMLLSFTACGKQEDAGTDVGGDTVDGDTVGGDVAGGDAAGGDSDKMLNVSITSDPGTLLPLAATSTGGFFAVTRALYDTPWNITSDGSMEMQLVESIDTVSEVQYTLHLRQGITFANGNPYTAEDFMFTMEITRDHPQQYLTVATVDFEKTKIIDDYTIEFWMKQYDISCFPGMAIMFIVDKESYDEGSLALTPNGTGAYELVEYIPNSHVVLQAREGYWGDPAQIKNVTVNIKAEESQRVNSIVTGDTHYSQVPLSEVEYLNSLDGYTVTLYPSAGCHTAFFNCSPDAPLGSVDARLAVMHAINRQAIVDLVFCGAVETTNYCGPNSAIGYVGHEDNFTLDAYEVGYDVELAKFYAEKAGLVGKTIVISTNGDATYNTIAELILNDLSVIGVTAEIVNYDPGSYVSTLMDVSTFDIGLLSIGSPSKYSFDMIYGYISFLPLGWDTENRQLIIDNLMAALGTPDQEEQQKNFAAAMQIWNSEHPWFTLTDTVETIALSDEVGGYEYYLDACLHISTWYWN